MHWFTPRSCLANCQHHSDYTWLSAIKLFFAVSFVMLMVSNQVCHSGGRYIIQNISAINFGAFIPGTHWRKPSNPHASSLTNMTGYDIEETLMLYAKWWLPSSQQLKMSTCSCSFSFFFADMVTVIFCSKINWSQWWKGSKNTKGVAPVVMSFGVFLVCNELYSLVGCLQILF